MHLSDKVNSPQLTYKEAQDFVSSSGSAINIIEETLIMPLSPTNWARQSDETVDYNIPPESSFEMLHDSWFDDSNSEEAFQ